MPTVCCDEVEGAVPALRGRARLRESWGGAEAKRGVRECAEGIRIAFHTLAADLDGA